MKGDTGSLIDGLPWFHDPMVAPDETYKAVRDGRLDLLCGCCGMMGKSGVWIAVYNSSAHRTRLIRCPNCGEYAGQPIQETIA